MGDILTEKQILVLKAIRDFFIANTCAPSLTELQRILGISTKRGVVVHLMALERKGYIIRTNEPRGIRLVDEDEESVAFEYMVGIPILGYVNAGTPLVNAVEENLGVLKVQGKILGKVKKGLFSVIVKGDSMNEEVIDGTKISDGNYLIVDKDSAVEDGDVVVAIIENSATVKIWLLCILIPTTQYTNRYLLIEIGVA
ncbi:MAG: LexA repressor [candidate division WS6 bacterium GW2011_GWE1_36_69]|nr:MAG: LexA repressor [candidate division WS6 bacterium GW2011_GWE1_36_69]